MTCLGIEILEHGARAVIVDDDGRVLASDVSGGSAATGADALIARLIERCGQPSAAGVVVRDPLAPEAREGAASLGAIVRPALVAQLVSPGAAVAIAETWCGAARGARHVVALTAGDGVHAGIIIDGRPFVGAHGLAGAAAWLALNPVEREDYRRSGCLEAEVGGPGIVRRLVWRIKAGDTSRVLHAAGGNLAAISPQHIFEAARTGDGVAISVVRDTAKYVGMAVSNLVATLDPEVVVLGGLLADASDLLLDGARAELVRRGAAVSDQISVRPAALGELAAAIGAARAAALGAAA